MSRLIDHFISWETGGGIFYGMTGMPWNDVASGIDPLTMDIEYFGNRSGLKQSSPLVEKMTAWPDDHEITSVEKTRLQAIIKQKFLRSWQRVYSALLIDYEPLENYDMTETTTPGATKTIKVKNDQKAEGSVYAFNSANPVKVSVNEGTGEANNNYSEESYTGFDKLERSGNIGVTTSAQMLAGELEVRRNTFLEIVYRDTDTILTRPSW